MHAPDLAKKYKEARRQRTQYDSALHVANRAAHRGMRVLCDQIQAAEKNMAGSHECVMYIQELVCVAREYEEAWQQAQKEAPA